MHASQWSKRVCSVAETRDKVKPPLAPGLACAVYSTVTDFARFRGLSTSVPFCTATW